MQVSRHIVRDAPKHSFPVFPPPRQYWQILAHLFKSFSLIFESMLKEVKFPVSIYINKCFHEKRPTKIDCNA